MMRKVEVRKRWGKIVLLMVLVLLGVTLTNGRVYAGTNDFYFEDFTADYYLSRAEDGTSRLHVKEVLTAVFPNFDQNHGINREIPFSNQDGLNRTIKDYNSMNFTVLRNGEPEPVSKVETENGYYNIYIGSASSYVHGRQIYTLEYDFINVVTEFDENGRSTNGLGGGAFQELYWDTNGTGWTQRFENLTARVHFDTDVMNDFTGESWCYVGKYGEKGQKRCVIERIEDGVSFTTSNLKAYENLTFDVEIRAGSFVVPEPEKNYILVFIMALFATVSIFIIVFGPLRLYREAKEKREFYKSLFRKPEYKPNSDYSIAEMSEMYMGRKKSSRVAVMLDMIVNKKITLANIGTRIRKKWEIKVLDLDRVDDQGRILLTILNGGRREPGVGDKIKVQSQYASTKLVALGKRYYRSLKDKMFSDGLVEKGVCYKGENMVLERKNLFDGSASKTIGMVMLYIFIFVIIEIGGKYLIEAFVDGKVLSSLYIGYLVGRDLFLPATLSIVLITILIALVLNKSAQKYLIRTKKGLEMARYMDGLRLYIKMAEADRIKFLQSVEGADMSKKGVVKIYEKLLPYAAVFGLEESWIRELEKYCEINELPEPGWCSGDVDISSLCRASMVASSYAHSSTSVSNGSGSSSSGFSGGDGGGSSGGGGGGGGGGGW